MNIRVWTRSLKCPDCAAELHVDRGDREYFIDVEKEKNCMHCNMLVEEAVLIAHTGELTPAEARSQGVQVKESKNNEKDEKDNKPAGEQLAKNELYKEFKDQAGRIGSEQTEALFDKIELKGNDRPTVDQASKFIELAKPLKGKDGSGGEGGKGIFGFGNKDKK